MPRLRQIWYVYPMWHKVSFTVVAEKQLPFFKEHAKYKYRVTTIDELALKHIEPHGVASLILHPFYFIMFHSKTYVAKYMDRFNVIIGIEVADTDRIGKPGLYLASYADAFIVPSKWAVEAYRRSGVRIPLYVVPHGVDADWDTRDPWRTGRVHSSEILRLRKLKEENPGLKVILYFVWHCYDEKTRVLTKEGFKYWWELKPDDEIATVNLETGELEYQKPQKILVMDYEGPMIHFESLHYDLLVTPNHRVIVRRSRHSFNPSMRKKLKNEVIDSIRPWEFRYAEEVFRSFERGKYEFMRAIKWQGKKIDYIELPDIELDENYPVWVLDRVPSKPRKVKRVPIRPLLRFLGWFIAEGSARYNKYNQEYMIIIGNKNKDYVEEIAQIIREMGFHPTIRFDEKKGVYLVIVASKQLYMFIKSLGLPVHPEVKGRKARSKFVPQFIKELSPDLIQEFIEALWKGDGTFYKTKDGRIVPVKYTTTSKRLAEDVAELMLKLGYAVTIHYDEKRDLYNVVVSERYKFPTLCKPPKIIHYKGKVWCVTVPNGTLIVERNGKIIVSGNSEYRKGLDIVVEAWKKISRERNDVVLVVKAPGVNPHLTGPRVYYVTSWINDDEKLALYDLADIVLLPSRGGSFELNALEGLARGKPVPACDRGPWTEYLPSRFLVKGRHDVKVFPDSRCERDIHCGYGCEVDKKKYVEKILDMLDNLDEYKGVAREHWAKIKQDYTWPSVGRRLYKVVDEIIEKYG